jgi:hypothetical protein
MSEAQMNALASAIAALFSAVVGIVALFSVFRLPGYPHR